MQLRVFSKLLAVAAAGLLSTAADSPTPNAFVPVLKENFPDAFVLLHGSRFIAYATNEGRNVPVAVSTDLVNWSFPADAAGKPLDAMPTLGAWAKEGFTWAPEVFKIGGKYLLYYTASDRRREIQCVGVAIAADPLGPFVDNRPEPLVCQTDLGGTIDANVLTDADGKHYLYYKNDGNRVRKYSAIWGQPLAPDGLTVLGQPTQLIRDDKSWEQKLVEAPTMMRTPGGYQLFFSAAYFGWNDDQNISPYGMGYANCAGPLGPCKKSPDNPILHSYSDRTAGCLSGPGHQSIFTVGAKTFMSFHAWAATSGCRKADDKRYLYIAPIFWKDGKPQIAPSLRPTKTAQRG